MHTKKYVSNVLNYAKVFSVEGCVILADLTDCT